MVWNCAVPSLTLKLAALNCSMAGVGVGVGVAVGVGVGVGLGVAMGAVPTKMSSWLVVRLLTVMLDGEKVKPELKGVTVKFPPAVVSRKKNFPLLSVVEESEREPLRVTAATAMPFPDESMTRPEMA